MRNKIIAVNAVIVLIVGLLSFVIVRQTLMAASGSSAALTDRAKRDVQGASARLQLDGLRAERWLATKAAEPATLDAVSKATATARGDAATAVCNSIASSAKSVFGGKSPSVVAIVDSSGKMVGRNDATLGRGEDVATAHPAFKEALAKGQSGSDVWVNKEGSDQFLASYAPVRDEAGKSAGALLLGMPLADEMMAVSDTTTGRGILLMAASGEVVATSTNTAEGVKADVKAAAADLKGALATGHAVAAQAGGFTFAAAPLEGFADGKRIAVVVSAPQSLIEGATAIPVPILAMTALGLVLVIMGGWLLGNYISGPIAALEEGLLAILNGQTDKRFELEHAELGGLAFRIDQLLNQLMGIEEDTTDAEGRVSKAPTAANFTDAMSVDGGAASSPGAIDPSALAALAAEPAAAYYARLYREYIAAKKGLGEQTDHITEAAFNSRIQGMEQDATNKHGKAVRYQVQATGREVILLAVPLP